MQCNEMETLRFLGKMNAHISHELRNIMATISETAGLMGDLIEIGAERGNLDPDRLTELCSRITALVDRGNDTIRNMNGLAHSMDEPVRDSDMNTEARLMAKISQYAPHSREVDLNLAAPEGVPLRTASLQVQHLLAELLAAAFATLQNDQRLPMRVAPLEGGATVTLAHGGNLDPQSPALKRAEAVAASLSGASITQSNTALELTLKNEA